MAFVRGKRHGDRTYYYLVETFRDDKDWSKVRHRTLAYLGKYATIEEARSSQVALDRLERLARSAQPDLPVVVVHQPATPEKGSKANVPMPTTFKIICDQLLDDGPQPLSQVDLAVLFPFSELDGWVPVVGWSPVSGILKILEKQGFVEAIEEKWWITKKFKSRGRNTIEGWTPMELYSCGYCFEY